MATALACLLAVLLNLWVGEPRRAHPLTGFGRLAATVERRWNRRSGRGAGVGAVFLLLLPSVLLAWAATAFGRIGLVVELLLLYLSLGLTGLLQHADAVGGALAEDDMVRAQREMHWLTGSARTVEEAAVAEVATSAVLVHGADAVFAPLFWFLLLGAPGVVLYRLNHTLAVIWDAPLPRYRDFGWAAVGLDRILSWIPARLTAFTYAVLGEDLRRALRCWHRQARFGATDSGALLASGAGALGVQFEGRLDAGQSLRTSYGEGTPAGPDAPGRAGALVRFGVWLWLGAIVAAAVAVQAIA